MAKRFTETNKWGDPWYRKLPIEYKAFWSFLCDNCDNAGVWKKDFEIASFYINAQIDEQIALNHFNTSDKQRVQPLKDGLWFLTDFIAFQYGELSKECKPHQQVLELLNKYRDKGLANPYVRVKDKDKEKDKGKEKEKDSSNRFLIFWAAYPKKKSRGQAKKAWDKISPSEQLLETMISTIKRAETSEDWTKEKGQYIPYPATWLNAEGWLDEYTPANETPVAKSGNTPCAKCGSVTYTVLMGDLCQKCKEGN